VEWLARLCPGNGYVGMRYYDAEIGRFLSVDPSSVRLDYRYGWNTPVNYVDHLGLQPDPNDIRREIEERLEEIYGKAKEYWERIEEILDWYNRLKEAWKGKSERLWEKIADKLVGIYGRLSQSTGGATGVVAPINQAYYMVIKETGPEMQEAYANFDANIHPKEYKDCWRATTWAACVNCCDSLVGDPIHREPYEECMSGCKDNFLSQPFY
jgi:uncharacterized protein RhaS with RHS repeats